MKKSIKKNYIYNLIYQIIILFVPLITTPYVSRVLRADGIGTYGYILSIVTYFILFGSLGGAMYGQREIAYVQADKEKRTKIFYEIVCLRFITMIIALITYFLIFGINGDNVLFYRIFSLEMFANMFDISWFFQGLEDFKKTVLRNIIVKIIGVFCIFIFVNTKNDLITYILIYSLSNLIGNISLWLYLPKLINKFSYKSLNFKKHLKPILLLFIPQIAIQIYTVLDRTMLGIILDDMNEVGYYEQSQKIIKVSLALVTAFGTVMAPRIANLATKVKDGKINDYLINSFHVAWLLGTAVTFGIMGVANDLVPWFFGPGYEKIKLLLMVVAPLNLAIGLNNVTGIQYLIQTKKQNLFTVSVVIGAIINFLLNIVGIKFFKSTGAAFASVIAEFSILIVQLIYMKHKTNFNVSEIFKIAIKYLVSGLLMFIIVYIMGIYMPSTIFTTALQVLVGGIVYLILLIVLKDKFFLENFNKVFNKLKLLRR